MLIFSKSLQSILNKNNRLNFEKIRNHKFYTKAEYLGRFLWSLTSPLFNLSPRNFFFWRSFLLRIFGAKVGRNVHIYPSAKIYIPWNLQIDDFSSIGEWALIYNLGKVMIGKGATISHKAQICSGTHQYESPELPLIKKNIQIDNYAWICTEAFIGPGCKVGEGAIVGAKSVVVKNINKWEIVAGNPAKYIKKRNLKKI